MFNQETPEHIRKSIAALENEIFVEFKLRFGRYMTMYNYWRLKFILFHSMNEREGFADLLRITFNTFKEDAERGLVHMKSLLQLEEPPFQQGSKGNNGKGANNANEDEAESVRKA